MKVVLAIDSFKGSISSRVAAEAAATGIRRCAPSATLCCVPIADGGEGTVEALVLGTGGACHVCHVHDPLMRPIEATYGVLGDGKTAVIEIAAASGLTRIAPAQRDPRTTTTYGTGELMIDAFRRGCTSFIIGLGGSATNDGGMGMLSALGARFLDATGKPLAPIGANLHALAQIDCTALHPMVRQAQIQVACDVTNPLFGPNGAAHVFARQKGADDCAIEHLDAGLRHYARCLEQARGRAVAQHPGAGAAGGLGAALLAFFNAELKSGIALILETIHFEAYLADADFVLTGEGCLDGQSLMGKAPLGVARMAAQYQVPVVAVAGCVAADAAATHSHYVDAFFPIHRGPISLAKAMQADETTAALAATAEEIARLFIRLRSN